MSLQGGLEGDTILIDSVSVDAGKLGAEFKMSDWEEEYDKDGVAIEKPPFKSAQSEYKLPVDDRQRENAFFGARNASRYGASRDGRTGRSYEGTANNSRGGGGEGRAFTRRTGMRTFGGENSGSSPPLTITVENCSIGRIIGRFQWLI